MRGIIAAMPFRTGGFAIPVITDDSSNIILEINLPSQSKILCTSCTIENESTLISNGDIAKITEGYTIKNNIKNLKIIRQKSETPPITIINGREILYCSNGNKKVTLTAPAATANPAILAFNNKLHFIGGTGNTHYVWDGNKWTRLPAVPYAFYGSRRILVHDNEIHALGSSSTTSIKYHYKFNGTNWVSVSTLPYNFSGFPAAVSYNGEIHIFGGSSPNSTNHYKFNGTEWVKVSTIPYNFAEANAVVYNDEIHLLGDYTSISNYNKHYKFDQSSSTWIQVSTIPYPTRNTNAVVYNNEIHILGGYSDTDQTKHYKWNGTSWSSASTLPYKFKSGSASVFNNNIHIIGGATSDLYTNHYIWDGNTWKNYSLGNAFNLPNGSRVNETIISSIGDSFVPIDDNYIIEY